MIGIGVNIRPFLNKVARAAADYYNLITADGGVSESPDCVNSGMSDLDRQNLLNNASLLLIPSGYKGGKLYSEIPTNGNGDLSFTRASNGTRINSAGLVEVCPWNLVTYSQQFTQYPPWLIQNITRADNVTTAPNGTTTAGKIYPSTTSSNPVLYTLPISVVSGQNYAVSIYAKAAGKNWIFIRTVDDSSAGVWFNLSTGVIGTQTSATGIIESVGNGWYRCTVIGAPTTTNGRCVYLVVDSNGSTTGTASGTDGIFVWGAQLNIGSTAKPYFPTTDRLNVPRLTYQNGGGGCPSLLLEKQSTNLFTYSEQFDNAAWTKNNITITANTITSPDGTQNADKIADSINTASAFYIYQSPATTSTQYTSSGYFKKGEYNFVTLHAFGLNGAVFNLNTGVLVSQSGGTGTITSVGDGWYRCTFTFTAGGSAVFFSQSPAGNISYTGTIGSGIYAWGLQCEASSYATSYIPTTSSSATRVADACSKTGISSLIGQTEGVLFVEVDYTTLSGLNMFLSIRPNPSNKVEVYRDGGTIYGEVTSSASFAISATKAVGTHKIAFAYKSGDSALYIDGVLIGQNTTAFTYSATLADLYINQRGSGGALVEANNYKEVILFPTRLTNAELASLTTL